MTPAADDTEREEQHGNERNIGDESRLLQQRWHGWGSPVGLGVGLLSVGGFFVLLAEGLSILASID
ncbi:MAG: hypothetical protein QNJ12_01025 [Ilumatobacter sp.]|uniref:hypothetical protein n=1 Tax=Ilumatobacter sp. TaxID=1967498 RepID=UPI0026153DC3|nr:hypothetical protein [Ilumatobacter sp.]MDJ0767334.1 hypothetical protein [Ilumatobacter sp.]